MSLDQILAGKSMNIREGDQKSEFMMEGPVQTWHISKKKKTCDFYPLHLSWII